MEKVTGHNVRHRPSWRYLMAVCGIALAGCTGLATPIVATPLPLRGSEPALASPMPTPSAVASIPSAAPEENPTGTSAPARGPLPAEGSSPAKPQGAKAQPVPESTFSVTNPFPPAPDRDLFKLASELSPDGPKEIKERTVSKDRINLLPGRADEFWLVDFQDMSVYQSSFDLRLVTPRAYWYVEEGQNVKQQDLERAAEIYEQETYPRVTESFGQEWNPGVDNDPHLNIIHAGLRGVGGYFSSSDEHPQSVFPYSNQREIIYINIGALRVGSAIYQNTLAHELQHAVHWNGDQSEDTWVNEGLSELAVSVAGYSADSVQRFLRSGPVSLIHWPLGHVNVSAHYGAASLFMHYLSEHYSGAGNMRQLVQEPADGIAGINAYLRGQGYDATFRDLFRDWAVANFLDEDEGIYGYQGLDVRVGVRQTVKGFSELKSEIPQYSVEYIDLTSLSQAGSLRVGFSGTVWNTLLPEDVGPSGCWWGNSGDSISSTLTREVDLRGLDRATLIYQVWFNLEQDWDYAYVEVSADGGRSWKILETSNTSPENPIGNSFGPGYTGESGGWLDERVDLTSYLGQEVLVRFQYVTDDAINGPGICIRQIAVPEAGMNDYNQGWQTEGFVLIDNQVKQDYIVQILSVGPENQVTALQLDASNWGEMVIRSRPDVQRLVVAVAALAPQTLQPAPYTLTVGPANQSASP